jgi:hypothetical protein
MKTIVHFSAFDHTNDHEEDDFIVKELAIVNTDLEGSQTWIFKPPFPFHQLSSGPRYTNEYLSKNTFGLEWNEGDVAYDDLKKVLIKYTNHSEIIYTYGKRRQKFLQKILEKTVINLEDINCPKFNELAFTPKSCAHYFHRFSKFRCAAREAWSYAHYVKFHELSLNILPQERTVYQPTPLCNTNVD